MPRICTFGETLFDSINLIIFDKDGTLFDIHFYWAEMIRLRAAALARAFVPPAERASVERRLSEAMGLDIHSGRIKEEGPVGIKPRSYTALLMRDLLQKWNSSVLEKDTDRIFQQVDDETSESLGTFTRVLPGVEALLRSAADAGIKLAIATTDRTQRAKRAMEAVGFSEYFDLIVGADLVRHHKPAPDCAQLILSELNVPPAHAIMVGDHPVDVELSKNCRMRGCIGVSTGLVSRRVLAQLDCHSVDTLEELTVQE